MSAAKVFDGSVAPEELARKLVLIGVTGLGLLDFQATALGERVPGVEIHAQILEQIFDGDYLRRPAALHALETALLAAAALVLAFGVASLGVGGSIVLYVVVVAALGALGWRFCEKQAARHRLPRSVTAVSAIALASR